MTVVTLRRNIVVTWPKTREFASYVAELRKAERAGEVINYRVGHPPSASVGGRCYMVHSGFVRGWTTIVDVVHRDTNEVRAVDGGYWPAGFYVVREPIWFPVEPVAMRGFQGWRYYEDVSS